MHGQLNNIWVIGYNSSGIPNPINSIYSIDFRNGTIDYDTASAAAFSFRGCDASICDSAGNLLFYTNGLAVMNAQHDTMVNGDSLNYSDEAYSSGGSLTGHELSTNHTNTSLSRPARYVLPYPSGLLFTSCALDQ